MAHAAFLLLLALVASLCVAQARGAVTATYEVVETPISYLPFYPPQYITAAVVNIVADEPVYVHGGLCMTNNVCAEKNIVPCCELSLCDSPTPPSDCACASQPNVQCIDENTPLDVTDDSYKTMSPTTIMYFEVTVNNSCHNMIFSQNGIRGDWSTVIGVASTAFEEILALSTHESSTYGNDDIVLCAAPFDGSEQLYQANLYNNLQYYESLRAADGFYRIRGAVQGSGSLRLTVSEITEPTGLVPLVDGTHLRYAQGIIAAECDGKMVPYAKFPPPYLPTFLPPTNDPLYDFTQYMGMLAPHPPAASLNRNQVSILFPLASDTYFTWTTIIGDIEKCKINLTMLRTANDTPIYDGVVYPVRSNITTCNRTDVAAMAAHHDALVANFTSTQVVTLANARIFGASGITGSVKFAQCKRFAQQYIVPVEFVVTNDTECYAQPGTDDFYFDPCCNVAAAWDASCTARRTIRSAYAPNNLLVADTCRTDACSNEVATALGTVTARLTSNSCARESLNNLVEVLDLFQAAQSGAQPGPCAGVFAFGTDEELVDCIVANIGEAYTQEFYTLWGVSAATAATTDFRTLLVQRYNKTGCQQAPFVAYYDTVSRTSIRNDSLDFDAAGCTSIATCNWFIGDQSLDPVTCTQSFRGPDMCASCDPASGACNEIGELMQCNAPYDVSFLQTAPDFCVNVLNGTFDFQVGLCRLAVADPTSNRVSHLACVPPDLAAFQLGPDATFAFPLCLVDFLSATDCDCSNPTAANQDACSKLNPDGFADPAAILFYVDNSFVRSYYGNNAYPDHCVVAAPTFYEQCLEVTNAKYFPGRAFAPGYLSTQAACQGAGGRCTAYDDPLYDIFYTEAECAAEATQRGTCQLSNCIGCDKTTCENTIGCSDVALIASSDFGSTVTDFITRGSNLAFCLQSSATDPTLGCIYSRDVSRLSAGEATQQFADYKPIYVDNQENRNQESCESFGRCQEATFAPGITTPKNKSACLAAGGQYLQAFRWGNGTFIPDAAVDPTGGWVTGAWVPREYKPHFAYAPMINRTGFATDFYSIQAAQQARSANQTSLCKTAQLLGLLTSLACDCQSQADGCYTTPQLQLLLLARACANLADYFPFSGNKGSFTVQSAVSTFSPSCVDITAEVVPYTLFRRSSANVYTSVFLQAVTAGPYAVLDNNDGISVGTLYGDGIKVSVSQGTLTGVYDICLAVDQDQIRLADRFRTPDFATVDANFKSDTFRALNLNCTLDRVASQICCLGVSSSAGPFFFPVMRVADAEGVRFRDTLTRSQRNCFWAAVFFYLLIWIFLAFRLVNYVLFLILRPVKYEWTNLILLGLILTFLFLAFTLRWTYFLVTPLGKLVNVARVGDLIYGELPFYFFLTVFTVIVAWWIELYHWAMSARRTFLSRMRWVLLGVNVFLYAFFIAVIIAYAVTSRKTSASSSVCATSTDDRGARILSKVYKTIISVIAAILALGFIVYGTVLVRILTSSSTMQVRSVVQFTLIAVASAVGLLVQCAILLYTTYAGKVNTVAALVVLIVAEIIPGTILAVAMRQPATQKSAIKELIWCMLPPDASMGSSTTNSKFTSKKTSGSTGASSGSARASGPTQTSSSPASSAADSRF